MIFCRKMSLLWWLISLSQYFVNNIMSLSKNNNRQYNNNRNNLSTRKPIVKSTTTSTTSKETTIVSSRDINLLVQRAIHVYESSKIEKETQQQQQLKVQNPNNDDKKEQQQYEQNQFHQIIIGVGGCPGSGKSTRIERVCDIINRYSDYNAKIISMDGYHISKQQLKDISTNTTNQQNFLNTIYSYYKQYFFPNTKSNNNNNTTNIDVSYDGLMKRRGAPWTFNSKQLVYDLQQLQQSGYCNFPIYSRDISDPILNRVQVSPVDHILFCEGNYLLCYNTNNNNNNNNTSTTSKTSNNNVTTTGTSSSTTSDSTTTVSTVVLDYVYEQQWDKLQTMFNDKWYIDVPIDIIKSRLVSRHLKRWTTEKEKLFGIGKVGATKKIESSDLLNAYYINNISKQYATVIIQNY